MNTVPTCLGAPAGFEADCGQPGPHGPHPISQLLPPPAAEVRCYDSSPHAPHETTFAPELGITNGLCGGVEENPRPAGCPDWCTFDHAEDDERDDLALHMGDDHTDSTVRDLLDVHQGSKLRVVVARTDDLSADTRGTPALLVTADLELTTWEQAAELARAILDGFGYLNGAEKR